MKTLTALKHLGQHFLHCPHVLAKITRAIQEVQAQIPTQHITEIGPGMGALTQYLRPIAEDYWVMEQDTRFAQHLTSYHPKLHILWGDALEQNWDACPFGVLAGNLPYNISVPLIFKWMEHTLRFPHAVFMVQKEVGKRVMAQPFSKAYGRLSVMMQSVAQVTCITDVGPGAFSPPPKVHSCVLHFIRRSELPVHLKILELLVRTSFSQRRKMLKNTLTHYPGKISWDQWKLWLNRVDVKDTARAEEVTVEQYIRLSNIIGEYHGMESR
jgi:16S rRNA (adenine1518-N6/adenine1519-N6)-dimethyltransferase